MVDINSIILYDVKLIDVTNCDNDVSPSINITFGSVTDTQSLLFSAFRDKENRVLKLNICEPLNVFRDISMDSRYNIRIEKIADNDTTSVCSSKSMVRILEIQEVISMMDDPIIETDYAEPYTIDKDFIRRDLLNKVNKRFEENDEEIKKLMERVSVLNNNQIELKAINNRLQKNKNDLATLEMTYKQLNYDI